MIYAEADIGRAVALILKNVDQCKGKTLKLFDRLYSLEEVSDTITKVRRFFFSRRTWLTSTGDWPTDQDRERRRQGRQGIGHG